MATARCATSTIGVSRSSFRFFNPPNPIPLANQRDNKRVHLSNNEIDEALWAAYRRYDKSAVMEKLLRRYLMPQRKWKEHGHLGQLAGILSVNKKSRKQARRPAGVWAAGDCAASTCLTC
jgi:hypothetical protein